MSTKYPWYFVIRDGAGEVTRQAGFSSHSGASSIAMIEAEFYLKSRKETEENSLITIEIRRVANFEDAYGVYRNPSCGS